MVHICGPSDFVSWMERLLEAMSERELGNNETCLKQTRMQHAYNSGSWETEADTLYFGKFKAVG